MEEIVENVSEDIQKVVEEQLNDEEVEEQRQEEEKELRTNYANKFIKEDLAGIINFCWSWNGTNGKKFGSSLPEDFVFNVLELIIEGRRKCYTKSYKHFRNSVYYHVRNEMLTYFKFRKKEALTEDSPESLFTITNAENFMEEGSYAEGAEAILALINRKEVREAIYQLFDPNNDVDELFVLDEYFKENVKREHIAEALKITAGEVTVIQKRINRRIEKLFNKNLYKV